MVTGNKKQCKIYLQKLFFQIVLVFIDLFYRYFMYFLQILHLPLFHLLRFHVASCVYNEIIIFPQSAEKKSIVIKCFFLQTLFFIRKNKNCFIFKRVFTLEISPQDETRPWTKSSLSIVKCLLLFTRFCRDEISSRDEFIPVKKTGKNFHPKMKKEKKT